MVLNADVCPSFWLRSAMLSAASLAVFEKSSVSFPEIKKPIFILRRNYKYEPIIFFGKTYCPYHEPKKTLFYVKFMSIVDNNKCKALPEWLTCLFNTEFKHTAIRNGVSREVATSISVMSMTGLYIVVEVKISKMYTHNLT